MRFTSRLYEEWLQREDRDEADEREGAGEGWKEGVLPARPLEEQGVEAGWRDEGVPGPQASHA